MYNLEQPLGMAGTGSARSGSKERKKQELTEDTEMRKGGSEGRSGQLIHDYEVWAELC